MEFNVRDLDNDLCYRLLTGGVLPRPIAWVSTQSLEGVANLAPFSFFNVASVTPPVLAFSLLRRPDGSEKDTLANIRATGEFVVHVVRRTQIEAMNLSCGNYAPEVDEFDLAGLEKTLAYTVKVPVIADAAIRYECRLQQLLELGNQPGAGCLVLGEVLHVHVADALWQEGRIDGEMLDAVGKLAGDAYTFTRDSFALPRP